MQALSRSLDAAIVVDATTRRQAGYVAADFEKPEHVSIRGRSRLEDVYVLPLDRAATAA